MSKRLSDHFTSYSHIFCNRTKRFFDKAELYTKGIMQSRLRNIERISEDLDAQYHQMQHFITESNWDERAAIDQVSKEVNSILPKRKLTGLIIDESGWVKKGDKSVGVGIQYCGNVGKISNCQVAVFGCLSNGDFASLVDVRLYLPQDWCNDPERCSEAGIPDENRPFKTKTELAIDIIHQQIDNGVCFDFIGADGYYGNDANLARNIDQMGYIYMLDIPWTQKIFTLEPELYHPQKKGAKNGETLKKLVATTPQTTVLEYMESLQPDDWEEIHVRNTTKGKLKGKYHFVRVFIRNKSMDLIEPRLLVIRKTISDKKTVEIKYSFTNAPLEQYTHKALAYMQAQRFFVEHSIKVSKQILGLDEFQTRKWLAWQHQVALNFMVSSFLLKEKLKGLDDLPLLSARDVKEWFVFKLYKNMTEDQFFERMYNRHHLRQRDITNSYLRI